MIDISFIKNLIKSNFNITPTNITELNTSGTINKAYLVKFNNRKLIIRLRENDIYAKNEFMKEQWFSRQCLKLGIPVPKIMYLGQYYNTNYLLEEYIEGITGCNYKNKDLIFEKIGTYSRKIKEIPISGYGLKILDFNNNIFKDDFYTSPKEQIIKNIEAITPTDRLIDLKIYDSKYLTCIRNSFSNLIFQDLSCVLNHGDISLSNTIINSDGIVYWIDFGSVNANLLYSEFANLKIETKENLVSFAKGFGISVNNIEKNLDTYRLLSAFDKLRWSLTTENKEYINWYSQNAINAYELYKKNIKSYER